MAATYSYQTGDGVTNDYLLLNINMPDANGGNVTINGQIQAVGGSPVAVSQVVALPAAPGAGSIYWIIECNHTTGACTLLQSTSGWPTVDPNNDAIFQDVLTPTTTDPALNPTNQAM